MQPPPAYEAPFATEEIPVEKDKVPEEENLPPYITKHKGVYNIGKIPINFNHETRNIINLETNEELHSPNLYDIFTNVNTEKKWEDLDKEEKDILGYLLVDNKGIYSNYGLKTQGENKKLKSKKEPWKNLYSHVWFNRFLYMNDEMFEKEIPQAQNY